MGRCTARQESGIKERLTAIFVRDLSLGQMRYTVAFIASSQNVYLKLRTATTKKKREMRYIATSLIKKKNESSFTYLKSINLSKCRSELLKLECFFPNQKKRGGRKADVLNSSRIRHSNSRREKSRRQVGGKHT